MYSELLFGAVIYQLIPCLQGVHFDENKAVSGALELSATPKLQWSVKTYLFIALPRTGGSVG